MFHVRCSHRSLQEKSDAERSDAGSQPAESDYDVDEEYDNDYAENYFDNGEGDDNDDVGGGGGDEGGGTWYHVRWQAFLLTPMLWMQDMTMIEINKHIARCIFRPSLIHLCINFKVSLSFFNFYKDCLNHTQCSNNRLAVIYWLHCV